MADKIVRLMDGVRHIHYVEPYFGGGAVMLRKDCVGVSEVANDIHKDLTVFWKVLQGLESFKHLQRLCEATPFSQAEYDDAELEFHDPPQNEIIRAWRFFVLCRQSLAGRMKSFAPLSKERTRRAMNEQASAWLTAIEGLPEVHYRMKRVVITCQDGNTCVQQQDGKQTLFYLDPTYFKPTRVAKDVYQHEMTKKQHVELLDTLGQIKGKFILSGYPSKLYGRHADKNGWNRHDFELPNNAAGGKAKRRMTECVWCNF